MLVVTGGEAMYADLGHFGALPIRLGWFAVVFPALLLNYLGQGAYLIGGAPVADGKLFYALAPPVAPDADGRAGDGRDRHRLAGADFRASSRSSRRRSGSASFRGSTSAHTHHAHEGQIYIPFVNWVLLIGCVALVLVVRLERGAGGGLRSRGVGRHGDHFGRDDLRSRGASGAGAGASTALVWGPLTALNAAFLLASLAQVVRGRLRAGRDRRRGLRRHGDLALGPQGDLRRPSTPRRR